MRTILLVDDEPHLTEGLRRALRREPYRVLVASSGQEALEILSRERVDVVVSDERMPGISGSELLARIRTLYPDTVRIMLTGHASLKAAIRAINDGEIYRFLTKPCREAELAVTIRQALQHRDLLVQARRLLRLVRHQTSLLEELEREYPGITAVRRTPSGEILVENGEGEDVDSLIAMLSQEADRAEGRP